MVLKFKSFDKIHFWSTANVSKMDAIKALIKWPDLLVQKFQEDINATPRN